MKLLLLVIIIDYCCSQKVLLLGNTLNLFVHVSLSQSFSGIPGLDSTTTLRKSRSSLDWDSHNSSSRLALVIQIHRTASQQRHLIVLSQPSFLHQKGRLELKLTEELMMINATDWKEIKSDQKQPNRSEVQSCPNTAALNLSVWHTHLTLESLLMNGWSGSAVLHQADIQHVPCHLHFTCQSR